MVVVTFGYGLLTFLWFEVLVYFRDNVTYDNAFFGTDALINTFEIWCGSLICFHLQMKRCFFNTFATHIMLKAWRVQGKLTINLIVFKCINMVLKPIYRRCRAILLEILLIDIILLLTISYTWLIAICLSLNAWNICGQWFYNLCRSLLYRIIRTNFISKRLSQLVERYALLKV